MAFSLNSYLFGPLDTEYCMYFYLLSVMHLCIFVFIIASLMYSLVAGNKKVDSKMMTTMLFGGLLYFAFYFQNRLLHSMCVSKEGLHVGKKNHSIKTAALFKKNQ
jgi:hypothetical protein